MTDAELKHLVASLAVNQRETELQLRETDRIIRELGKQIGGLGSKFGSFTEGLAYQSCKRILREDFGMDTVAHELLVRRPNGENEEYDMLGIVNGPRQEIMVVEMKSHLTRRDVEQMKRKCRELPRFLPAYHGMKVYGLFAAVHVSKGLDDEVNRAGLYLATGADENFHLLSPPKNFKPTAFAA